jgi:tetratricopeptide (TPR) repeat protein
LKALHIEVNICGHIARTSWQMVFKNNTSRILEGTLNFPLKEGISVSRYALDIDGKMREAVPVDRNKGAETFEAIERRGVDPGLLEKAEGNIFRTRIYPINPNSTRTVIIGFEEELASQSNLIYQQLVPIDFKDTVADFSCVIKIMQAALPPSIEQTPNIYARFTKNDDVYTAEIRRRNFVPKGNLVISIPQKSNIPSVLTQEFDHKNYFIIHMDLPAAVHEKVLPKNIVLLWDASLSGSQRDLQKEKAVLTAYFKAAGSVSVTLVTFGNSIYSTRKYDIINGNTQPLMDAIDEIVYDGATNFGCIGNGMIPADEYILCSDGRQTFGNEGPETGKIPVHCISSAPGADFSNLKYISYKSGGVFINLQQETTADAIKRLASAPLRFLGLRQNNAVAEYFPATPVPVSGSFSIAGIATAPLDEIELQFGYGNEVSFTKKVNTDFLQQGCEGFDIAKIFAQKKISELDIQYEKNKTEIESLGNRFGIVTRNTSLIVLETLDDYLRYEIEPPAELKKQYDSIIQVSKERIGEEQENKIEVSKDMLQKLKEWWNKKPVEMINKPVSDVPLPPPPPVTPSTITQATTPARKKGLKPTPSGNKMIITGKVVDKEGEPVPFAVIKVKGTRTGTAADARGNYSLKAKKGDVLQSSAVGFKLLENKVKGASLPNLVLEKQPVYLTETVVTTAADLTGDLAAAASNTFSQESFNLQFSTSNSTLLQGRVAGLNVASGYNNSGTALHYTFSNGASGQMEESSGSYQDLYDSIGYTGGDNRDDSSVIHINKEEEAAYLLELKNVNHEMRYKKYIELRKAFENIPVFYFKVGSWFIEEGDKETGIKILSNLAEMETANYELYKMLGYKLKEAGDYQGAINAFAKVKAFRTNDPQSYRDLALAKEDAGLHQEALDILYEGMERNYSKEKNSMYAGIEEIFLMEINRIVSLYTQEVNTSKIPKELLAPLPVDIRIVMNWNKNNSDIDLWVTDPANEKCFYQHKTTNAGGRISNDLTQGFGPEQFILKNALKGKYKIEINYYADRQVTIAGPTTVMAEIFLHYGMPNEVRKIITLQMEKGKLGAVYVGEIEF